MENDNSYDELKRDAKLCLSLMSQGLLYPHQVPLVLQVLNQVRVSIRNLYLWLEFLFTILRISQKSAVIQTIPDISIHCESSFSMREDICRPKKQI